MRQPQLARAGVHHPDEPADRSVADVVGEVDRPRRRRSAGASRAAGRGRSSARPARGRSASPPTPRDSRDPRTPGSAGVLERDQRGHQLGGARDGKLGVRVLAEQLLAGRLLDQRRGADPSGGGGGVVSRAGAAVAAVLVPGRRAVVVAARAGGAPASAQGDPAMPAPKAASATTTETAAAAARRVTATSLPQPEPLRGLEGVRVEVRVQRLDRRDRHAGLRRDPGQRVARLDYVELRLALGGRV